MRFICTILSFFLLAIGVVLAVVDATRSIAAHEWVFTPLSDSWQSVAPGLLASVEAALRSSSATGLWDAVNAFVLQAPGWAVFFVLGLLFMLAAGRRKRPDEFAHGFH